MIAYQILRRNVSNFGDGSTKSDPFAQIESSIKVRLMPFSLPGFIGSPWKLFRSKKSFFFKNIETVFSAMEKGKLFLRKI